MPIKKSFHVRAVIAALLASVMVFLFPFGQPERGESVRLAEEVPGEDALAVGGSLSSGSTLPEPIVEFSIEDFCDSATVEQWTNDIVASAEDSTEAFSRLEAETAARLSISKDPEHLHAAALLEMALAGQVAAASGARETDPGSRARQVALISRALDADPDNPLHLWGAVQICMAALAEWNENRTDCPLEAWQARLLEADPQNREVWAYASVNLLAAGDESGALQAMQNAGALTESRVYWPETVEMLERALQSGTDWPFMARSTEAFGVAIRTLSNESKPMGLCRDQSEVSQAWANACLAYGQRNEHDPPIETGREIAIAIQQYALTALDEREALAELNARWLQQRQRRLEIAEAIGNRVTAAFANPTLFTRYLQLVRELGEFDARIAFDREAQAWVRRHQDAECIP